MAGIIFYGKDANTEAEAYAEAKRHLHTENPETELCFFRYRDKISMDDIRELLSKINLVSDGYVVWFDRADYLSVNSQNALLKALEDRDDVLFVFIAENRLLGTIESRCEIRQAKRLSQYDFFRIYKADEAYFFFSMGSEEILVKALEDPKVKEIVGKVKTDIFVFLDNPKEVLETFGMLSEKGNSFLDTHKEYLVNLYALFESLLFIQHISDARALRVLTVIEEHKEILRRSNSYGKNDFFDFLVGICEKEQLNGEPENSYVSGMIN